MEWFDPTGDAWGRSSVACSREGCNEVMTPATARWAIDYTAADPVQLPFCSLRCRTRWRVLGWARLARDLGRSAAAGPQSRYALLMRRAREAERTGQHQEWVAS